MDIKEALLKGCQDIMGDLQMDTEDKENEAVASKNLSTPPPSEMSEVDEEVTLLNDKCLQTLAEKIVTTTIGPINKTVQMVPQPVTSLKDKQKQVIVPTPIKSTSFENPINIVDSQEQEPHINHQKKSLVGQSADLGDLENSVLGKTIQIGSVISIDSITDLQKIDIPGLIARLGLDQVEDLKQWSELSSLSEEQNESVRLQAEKKQIKPMVKFQPKNDVGVLKHPGYKLPQITMGKYQAKALASRVRQQAEQEQLNGEGTRSRKLAKKGGKEGEEQIVSKLNPYNPKPIRQIDLGSTDLPELVGECFKQNILSEKLFQAFKNNYSLKDIQGFIELFNNDNINSYDFNRSVITIFDHRRITEILIKLFPQEYVFTKPRFKETAVRHFLQQLYELNSSDYFELVKLLDQKSEITWWKELQKKIQKGSSGGRMKYYKRRELLDAERNNQLINVMRNPNIAFDSQGFSNKNNRVRASGKGSRPYALDSSSLSSEENNNKKSLGSRKKTFK